MKDSNDSSEPQAAPQRARLDAFAEDFLERLLDVATHLYGTPTALLALAQEDDRLRVAAATTMGAGETEFYRAACQRVVQVGEAIFLNGPAAAMLFADATHDDVPTPRFFAGAPVRAPDGQIAGALCVVGRQAPSTESPAPLETLARVAADELELLRAATKAPPAANRDTAGRSAENAGAEDAGTDAASATEGAASASAPLDLSGPLFQQHPLPMWVYDLNTLRFLAVNEAAVEAYGYSADEFRQMRITDIRPDDEVSRLWATLEQPHAGRQQTARGTHRTQDGRTLHVETTSRVLSGETRDAVLVTVQNVTPYAEALRDLRSRERRLDQTLASIGDAVITTDPSTRVTRMNAAAEALTGWTQDDAEGHPLANVLELQHAQTGEPVAPPVREAMRSRARVSLPAPTTLVARDGSERPVADSAAPILDDDGTLLGGVLVLHDVSDARAQEKTRRSQRQRLQRQQRMFATLAEQARDVWNDIDRLLQTTTEIVSEAFDAQRVGVWRYDAEQPVLEGLDTYDRAAGTHTGGTMLTESDCPAYFNALSEGQVIAIDDARRDVRTIGLESAYLADHGIAALLDAPIRVGGRPIGVLCIEAVGEGRSWTTDEQIAARSVADFIALAFESSGRRETESALRESEEQLDLALRGVDLGLWDWNVQGNSGDRWAEMLGFRLDDLSGHADAVADLVPPDDRAAMQDALEAHLAGETPYFECEFRARTENGAWRWFLSRGRVVASTDDGDPQRVVGTTLDITERKEQAAAVERFGRLLEASANEITIFRADTLAIVQANRGAREHLGYAEDELLGMTPLDIKPFGREALEERLRPLRSGNRELLTFETTHRRKDGSTYPVRVRLQLSSQETPPVFIAIAHDITAEKEAERALRESEQRFRDVVEATGEYVWELNADRAYTFVTDQVEAVKGHGAQAVLGRTPFDFMPEADAQAMRTALDRAEAEQEPFTLEHRNRTPDGGVEWERASGVPVVDDDGAVVGFRGTGLSVTEQREVEQAMREQQARLRGIANSVPGVIYQFYVRPDGTRGLHFVSDRAQSILGLAPDPDTFFEALQTHIPEAHREVHRSAVAASVDAAEPWDYEVPFDTADGERLWLRNVATPERRDGELVFNGVVLDITERKQAQKDLQREQEFLQKLFDRIPVLITLYAPDQSHFQVNKEFERVLGWSSDELDDLDLMEACYPDPEVREEATAFMASPGPEWRDFPVRTKDGDEVLCSWTNIRLSDDTMVGVGIDRTERRQLEAQLRRRHRARLQQHPARRHGVPPDGPGGPAGREQRAQLSLGGGAGPAASRHARLEAAHVQPPGGQVCRTCRRPGGGRPGLDRPCAALAAAQRDGAHRVRRRLHGARRSAAAAAGGHEPDDQRRRRHGRDARPERRRARRGRARHRRRRGHVAPLPQPGPRPLRPPLGKRHGRRHGRRDEGTRLRAVLHDQRGRARHRAGPLGCPRHRTGPRR